MFVNIKYNFSERHISQQRDSPHTGCSNVWSSRCPPRAAQTQAGAPAENCHTRNHTRLDFTLLNWALGCQSFFLFILWVVFLLRRKNRKSFCGSFGGSEMIVILRILLDSHWTENWADTTGSVAKSYKVMVSWAKTYVHPQVYLCRYMTMVRLCSRDVHSQSWTERCGIMGPDTRVDPKSWQKSKRVCA